MNFEPVHGTYIKRFPVGTGETISKGDAVYIASGYLKKALNTTTALLGVCAENVSNPGADGAVFADVYVANIRSVFKATASATVARSNLYGTYDLTADQKVDLAATTTSVVRIVDFPNGTGEDAILGTTVFVGFNKRQEN